MSKEKQSEIVVLASASPRRKELLGLICPEFEVIPSQGEELIHSRIPSEVVLELSCRKAEEIADKVDCGAIVIGADTIVAYGDRILGKPRDAEDAKTMLHLLSGHCHQVYTGVTLIRLMADGSTRRTSFFEKTDVYVVAMTEEEIDNYARTNEPLDKAGAYAIQGKFAPYIEKIDGDYYNVVGLPVSALYRELKAIKNQ